MKTPTVQVITDKTKQLAKAMAALVENQIYVGVPQEKAPRKKDPINNAALGYIHEFGSPENNIPARPFLVPGVRKAKARINKRLEDAGKAALNGSVSGVEKNLAAAGLEGRNAVVEYLTKGVPPPLKPATLAERKRKGRTGETPLIDTGQLRASITYVVRKI